MGEGTFAGTRGNDKVAPKAVTRSRQRERLNSTHERTRSRGKGGRHGLCVSGGVSSKA
jgi:hypothetical protein